MPIPLSLEGVAGVPGVPGSELREDLLEDGVSLTGVFVPGNLCEGDGLGV